MLSFFPRGILDEILNLIESVSEGFLSYFCVTICKFVLVTVLTGLLYLASRLYRGYLLFEVKTKFILSNALKISVISRVRSTNKIADIFNT